MRPPRPCGKPWQTASSSGWQHRRCVTNLSACSPIPRSWPRLAFYRLTVEEVLSAFDAAVRLCDAPGKSALTCRDADDQKFIDLAIAHQALLLSKDRHILSMRKRILASGARAQSAM